MDKLFFAGLEQSMENGCYISVLQCYDGYTTTLVKLLDSSKVVTYFESGNVISSMSNASKKIIDQSSDMEENDFKCYQSVLDRMVEQGYVLHFIKLSDKLYFATVSSWEGKSVGYVPVVTSCAENLSDAFKSLSMNAVNYSSNMDCLDSEEKEVKKILLTNLHIKRMLKSRM